MMRTDLRKLPCSAKRDFCIMQQRVFRPTICCHFKIFSFAGCSQIWATAHLSQTCVVTVPFIVCSSFSNLFSDTWAPTNSQKPFLSPDLLLEDEVTNISELIRVRWFRSTLWWATMLDPSNQTASCYKGQWINNVYGQSLLFWDPNTTRALWGQLWYTECQNRR
jgi:hypothetical protein